MKTLIMIILISIGLFGGEVKLSILKGYIVCNTEDNFKIHINIMDDNTLLLGDDNFGDILFYYEDTWQRDKNMNIITYFSYKGYSIQIMNNFKNGVAWIDNRKALRIDFKNCNRE